VTQVAATQNPIDSLFNTDATNILVYSERGYFIKLSTRSVSTSPYLVKFMQEEDAVFTTSFIEANNVLLLSSSCKIYVCNFEKLDTNKPYHISTLCSLFKIQETPKYLVPTWIIDKKADSLILGYSNNQFKKISRSEVSTRGHIKHPVFTYKDSGLELPGIKFASLINSKKRFPINQEISMSLDLSGIEFHATKRIGRLPALPKGLFDIKDQVTAWVGGYCIRVSEDRKYIFKSSMGE
jgi:hypothetical protein